MQSQRLATGALTLIAVSLQACSHALPKFGTDDPVAAVRTACGTDGFSKEVTGSVWIKAKSREASGQFPAEVRAIAAPSKPLELQLEIKQLLGARAALIEIRGHDFKVETPKDGAVTRKASSWGGIPLEWASQLFLDRFPCPSVSEMGTLRWRWLDSGELEGRSSSGQTVWRFKFRSWNESPWVESVFWQKSEGKTLDVKRGDPDPQEGWAQRWEASSPSGHVKVRWKNRKTR